MSLHCHNTQRSGRAARRSERGQVLVIAVSVMFLLAFVAGMFLTIISRNMSRTARGQDVVQAQYLAEAGIRYADNQLTQSMLGADWRPDPVNQIANGDPDADFLRAGFTRFNQGNGRFLLRVSYSPVELYFNPDDPNDPNNGKPLDVNDETRRTVTNDRSRMDYSEMGRYIKIESIGRRGVVDPGDPTTWGNADPLRRMLIAYKPIGITDYARFVTNKDRSTNTMVLGASPFPVEAPYDVTDGRSDNQLFRTHYVGPIRVNGDLMWSGLNTIYLNSAEDIAANGGYLPSLGLNTLTPDLVPVSRGDNVAVAGRIFHDWPLGGAPAGQVRLRSQEPSGLLATELAPSDSPDFDTANGRYRDASAGQSAKGSLRGVARLEPPRMDSAETSTGILRYRLITRETGVVPPGGSFNTGRNGLGMGIYVDNGAEIQRENRYRRLPDEWAQSGTGREIEAAPGSAWRQHLYTPPGAEVYLDPTPSREVNTGFPADQSQGTLFITRHDGKPWRDENDQPEGFTRRYRYPLRRAFDEDGNLVNSETYGSGGDSFRDADGAYKTFQNGVMFFEGNVRVQGKLPSDWRSPSGRVVGQNLTIVTMGTAYIEGNLLKGNPVAGDVNGYGDGLQVGSISVIARNYVCVNPTAYFMKQPDSGAWNFGLGNPYTELASAGDTYRTAGFGVINPADYPRSERGWQQALLMLQTAEDYSGGAAEFTVARHRNGGGFFNDFMFDPLGNQYSANRPMIVTPGQSSYNPAEAIWQHAEMPLSASGDTVTSWGLGAGPLADWFTLQYRPYYGPSPFGSDNAPVYTRNYNRPLWLSRMAISPLDVRIEAVLYAQEGSFFVIPGDYLNTNPADVRNTPNAGGNPRYNDPVAAGWRVGDLKMGNRDAPSIFPFFAEPADIRVVVDGAITENMPADKDYQTAWARHWGWSPRERADGTESPHGGEGLVYMYDHDLRVPLRFDRYARPLPPMPALPVSPDLIYFGEAG